MEALKQIPPVNDILRSEELSSCSSVLDQPFVARLLEEVLSETRRELEGAQQVVPRRELTGRIARELSRRIEVLLRPSLRPVINASGVIIHTNLGRAPLSAAALDHLREVSAGYSNLEFDLEEGRRGKRDAHVDRSLCELLGAEAAVVVNNNAAAVLLVLNSLADGGEVVISRGEQVEIGGSFRMPEVMTKSGVVLREVGTTNRTKISDYEAAIGNHTRLLLRVHPSNFRMLGFTGRPSLEDFVKLGHRHDLLTFEDLGSGCLRSMAGFGVHDEPVVADSIRTGVDVVSFSGDKLLGGPQSGIIAGQAGPIRAIRANPLFRALRVDKLTIAVLETTLMSHLKGDLSDIPVWRMASEREDDVKDRVEAFVRRAGGALEPVRTESVIGGGSAPKRSFLPGVSRSGWLTFPKGISSSGSGPPPHPFLCGSRSTV